MPEFVCVTKTQWGAKPKYRRQWTPGETVVHDECPSPHFETVDPFEQQATTEGFDVPASSMMIDWNNFTKSQINQRFNLGYTVDTILKMRKSQLINESIEVMKEEG